MKFISVCTVLVFFLSFSLTGVVASNKFNPVQTNPTNIQEALGNTPPLRFLPSHPLYFTITFKEFLSRFFKSSAAKRAQFDLVLADKRLKEAYLLYENNRADLSQKNLNRYSQRLEKLIKQIGKAQLQNQEVAPLADIIAQHLAYQEIILSSLYGVNNLNLEGAVSNFRLISEKIVSIDPSIEGRFKSLISENGQEEFEATASSEVATSPFPSVIPRRIIY